MVSVVGVIGAGVMGVGVAQCAAQAGYEVVLIDLLEEILDRARNTLRDNLRLHALLNPGAGRESDSRILRRVACTVDFGSLERVDFVIENVTESWPIKQEVYGALERCCREHCVFAANTSAVPITRIAAATRRPDRVIGMHFMNPAPLKPTVELIKGSHTSAHTIELAIGLLRRMGKDCILVNDAPGFVSNRILMLTINEAVNVLADEVAAPEQIDLIFTACLGHKMGPLATADLIGLDTVLHSLEVLQQSLGDKFSPAALLRTMVANGLRGRKSGRGFYEYPSAQLSASPARNS